MSKLNYDDAMQRLDDIVAKLESGDLGIEDALKEYEEGIKLVEFCEKYLSSKEDLFKSIKAEGSQDE